MNRPLRVNSIAGPYTSFIELNSASEEMQMRKEHEALLVAALAGLVIVGAAAFVVQPSFGSKTSATQASLSQPIALQAQTFAATRLG